LEKIPVSFATKTGRYAGVSAEYETVILVDWARAALGSINEQQRITATKLSSFKVVSPAGVGDAANS
jgi:hypothetical protein